VKLIMDRVVIYGGKKLKGTIRISGAKNALLPILTASLLTNEKVILNNVPNLRDIESMCFVLKTIGAETELKEKQLIIDASNFNKPEAPYDMVRKMRASIYVLGPMIARLGQAQVSLPGGCAIGPRPVDLHLKGMEALGATIRIEHGNIIAKAHGLRGNDFSLEGKNGSSVGATCNTLMAAVLAKGKTIIRGAAKEPEVVDLIDFLNKMGAKIEGGGTSTLTIDGVDSLKGTTYDVIPDRIEAGTFMVASAITNGDVYLENCHLDHMAAVVEKLREAGVIIEEVNGKVHIYCSPTEALKPVSIRTLAYPGFPTDMQAQFMALMSIVEGESQITETIYPERFIHISELLRMGADIRLNGSTAIIKGVKSLSGAPVMASDLRASAALILAGLVAKDMTEVLRIYHLDRGYEKIEEKLSQLGAEILRVSPSWEKV